MQVSIRRAESRDEAFMVALLNACAESGEVVYSPMDGRTFSAKFGRPDSVMLVADARGETVGWVHGVSAGDAYLTAIFVSPGHRRRGVGSALLSALEDTFRKKGKRLLVCSGNNPVKLDWRVPNTPGHDHNNAPGVDKDCAGYPFLIARGMRPEFHEVAMYMDLSDYRWPEKMDEIGARLESEGISVGFYDGARQLEFDGMCDRVGSEYWRNVLRQEMDAWRRNAPCADETLWVDGRPPAGPRALLLAVKGDSIVGFTGPVDRQDSGRGWFTGICVDPLYGKRSIGTLLFHMLLRAFVDEKAAFTTLFTGADNHAQQVYLRAGLSVVRSFAVMAKPLAEDAGYDARHF